MKYDKISLNNNDAYMKFSFGEVEQVNPIELYKSYQIEKNQIIYSDLLARQSKIYGISFPDPVIETVAKDNAINSWHELESEINQIPVPENFKQLLNSQKKKDQVRLLKGFQMKPFELLGYIFYAFTNEKYYFTQIIGEHDPIGYDAKEKPIMAKLEGDDVVVIGETKYTKGELKQLINQRKRTVAKILERGEEWHCFFITYSSLRGDESWKGGQPHFHYLSDKFGISKEDVKNELKSRKYKLGNLPHIDLIDMPA